MIHVLAAFTHGVLTICHVTGVVYNCITGKWGRAALHAFGAGLSGYATYEHSQEVDQ